MARNIHITDTDIVWSHIVPLLGTCEDFIRMCSTSKGMQNQCRNSANIQRDMLQSIYDKCTRSIQKFVKVKDWDSEEREENDKILNKLNVLRPMTEQMLRTKRYGGYTYLRHLCRTLRDIRASLKKRYSIALGERLKWIQHRISSVPGLDPPFDDGEIAKLLNEATTIPSLVDTIDEIQKTLDQYWTLAIAQVQAHAEGVRVRLRQEEAALKRAETARKREETMQRNKRNAAAAKKRAQTMQQNKKNAAAAKKRAQTMQLNKKKASEA